MPARALASIVFVLLVATLPAQGQVQVSEEPLPSALVEEVLALLNAPEALRLSGGARIPIGTRIDGNVAVLGGSLQLAGTVAGSLVVVNGDLRLTPGARVEGDVLVVGGALVGVESGEFLGAVRVYARPLRYRVEGGLIEAGPEDNLASGFLSTDLGFGEARLGLRASAAYNRVEGLPVRLGPVIQTGGSNPMTLETFAIWRSVSGLHLRSDELGYWFRLTQGLGGRGNLFLGAEAYDDTRAVEDQGLSDMEASLSTFLLRRDPRDYYDRRGWTAFLEFRPARVPFAATVSYSYEDHDTPPIRGPWALREGEDAWRPLALAAAGNVRSVEASILWNSQNDPVEPSDGWWLSLGIRRQVGGELRSPPSTLFPATEVPPSESDPLPLFTRGSVDLRRYARVGPSSRLIVRAAATGNLTDGPLPPQLQTALGGEGSLPGHARFAVDCGARAVLHVAETGADDGATVRPVFPAYGCDRTVLFQAEFRGTFPLSWNPLPDEWEGSELANVLDLRPVWSVFFDAGQGWARGSLGNGLVRTDSPTRADVGVGIFVGPLGLYWSYPLNRRDRGVNFFVRLERRF